MSPDQFVPKIDAELKKQIIDIAVILKGRGIRKSNGAELCGYDINYIMMAHDEPTYRARKKWHKKLKQKKTTGLHLVHTSVAPNAIPLVVPPAAEVLGQEDFDAMVDAIRNSNIKDKKAALLKLLALAA